jgi:nucleotide-binding universal stress UspA family protein
MTAATDAGAKRRILVCYDGSPGAQRALARAAEIAAGVRSLVTVISVAEPLYGSRPYTGWADPREQEAHRRLLDDATRTLAEDGVVAATLEPAGDTVETIVEAARDTHADMIVVGSSHHRLLQRLVPGSVSGGLVADPPCDVLVVR